MTKLTFNYDVLKKVLSILFYGFLTIFFFFVGRLNIVGNPIFNLIFHIVYFAISGASLVSLIMTNFIGRKIYLDGNDLCLCFLNKKKCVHLDKALWYAKNVPNVSKRFCKSKKNICLFYEGKKVYVSVKEIDILESKLVENKIAYISEQDKDSVKNGELSAQFYFFEIVMLAMLVTITNFARLSETETQVIQNSHNIEKIILLVSGAIVIVTVFIESICVIKEKINYKKSGETK